MQSSALSHVDLETFKNSLFLTTSEISFSVNNIDFKFEPLIDSLGTKFRNPVSVELNAIADKMIFAMEFDNLVEFCSHLPNAAEVVRSSVKGGPLVIEFAALDLWDAISEILGVHVQPVAVSAGDASQHKRALYARVTSSQGHDFPVSISSECSKTIDQFYKTLVERDPDLTTLKHVISPAELIHGRIFAGMMNAPREAVSKLEAGDSIEITSNASTGIEGVFLLADNSALPIRLFPRFAEFVSNSPTLDVFCDAEGNPDLSKIGAAPRQEEVRLSFMFARSSLTMKDLRRATLNGGLDVNLLEEIQLVGEGGRMAVGHLVDMDDVTKFVVDRVI